MQKIAHDIGSEQLELALEHAAEYALEQVRNVARDLGCNDLYKKSNQYTNVLVVYKFNVIKLTLISKIEEKLFREQ